MKKPISILLFSLLTVKAHTQSIRDYFIEFPFKGAVFQHFPQGADSIMADDKNAFLFMANYSEGLPVEAQFTRFVKADHTNLFGYRIFEEGGDGNSSYHTCFFTCRNGIWSDVTKDVCPELSLEDVAGSSAKNISKALQQGIVDYQLPQKGTTLQVILQPVSEVDNQEFAAHAEVYHRWIRQINAQPLQLYWDKPSGRFIKK